MPRFGIGAWLELANWSFRDRMTAEWLGDVETVPWSK
jgi:hypothetical protein